MHLGTAISRGVQKSDKVNRTVNPEIVIFIAGDWPSNTRVFGTMWLKSTKTAGRSMIQVFIPRLNVHVVRRLEQDSMSGRQREF